ncbi:hypothetical protein [Streptomyces sp. NPDC002889]|uniref:hypothetical protein n=1 Tax=Streptomyces sp. NPDC002889 TaxID=3364669 RepID=UPI0036A74542
MSVMRAVLRVAMLPLIVLATVSSCALTNGPVPMDFGYRMEGGHLVVVRPSCPSETVLGATVAVSVEGDGRGDGFESLWSASDPTSGEVRGGLFVVGGAGSFKTERKPLPGKLPDEFYVEAWLDEGGQNTDSGSVDLTKLRSAKLADDEYMTWSGKVMTRDQINAQRKCKVAS